MFLLVGFWIWATSSWFHSTPLGSMFQNSLKLPAALADGSSLFLINFPAKNLLARNPSACLSHSTAKSSPVLLESVWNLSGYCSSVVATPGKASELKVCPLLPLAARTAQLIQKLLHYERHLQSSEKSQLRWPHLTQSKKTASHTHFNAEKQTSCNLWCCTNRKTAAVISN